MNFKDFCKNDNSKINKNLNSQKFEAKNIKEEKIKENFEENLKKYSNFSNDELLAEFLKQSKDAKQSGMYNNDSVEKLKNTLFPFLNEEQKEYFDSLINMVK